jgi:5-formyltetrahydrofolate cyclo-ligase
MASPSSLRHKLRSARRALAPAEQRRHALRLKRLLGRHPAFLRAKRVAAYWPTDGEIDPFPLLRLAHARRKRCLLPVLRTHPKKKLWFVDYRPGEPLRKNHYGIPEPRMRNRRIRLPFALDLLLLPLVGFDADLHRLGMGGGYYDRTLAYRRLRSHWRRPRLIGIAHECQRVEQLEANPWDVPLDLVATEKGVHGR